MRLKRHFLYFILFGLLAGAQAEAAVWHAMDWIDGWYETSLPSSQQSLGVDQVTINCKDLSVRTTPQACISWIQTNPVPGITQYVPYINANAPTFQSNAILYSSYTVGAPVPEVDLDDFFGTYSSWYGSMSDAPQFLSQAIANLKSINRHLKFGITLYENELDPVGNPYIDNTHLPVSVKAQFDVVRLFLHYRANGPNYAAYVSQAKAFFPNAQIVAGVYPYDRIDYWPCAQTGSALCTQQQEMSDFQQTLTLQVQLLQQGVVTGLDCFPGYFGDETNLFGPGPNSDNLTCGNAARCVQNTVAMRNLIAAAYAGFMKAGTAPSITQQPGNTSLQAGQTQIFSIAATGTTPLSYQWKRNDVPIANATTSSYRTPPATAADNNSTYVCVVSNLFGSATSNAGMLTVASPGVPPTITRQPTNTTLLTGETQIFSVTATGTSPLSYQWQKNGAALSGAMASSYHTLPVSVLDNFSQYTCVVSNAYGSITSNPGHMSVSLTAAAEQGIAEPAPATQVYPNPWRSDRHTGLPLTFNHLGAGSTLKIFTISARLVKTLTCAGRSIGWDLHNDAGNKVASGLYLYLATDDQGQTVHGKFAVIN